MKRLLLPLLLAAAFSAPTLASAATKYVRAAATGANNGTDWTNAYTKLPTTLTRGDTYYIGDGTYGNYTFDDANSGTALITLRKATTTDHGTATGWNNEYGNGQAVFSNWQVYTDYYVFDGQTRDSNWQQGATSQYGIRVIGASPVRLDNGAGTGGDNLTFRYIDIHGGGRDTGNGDDVIYGLTGNSNITFQYCALHDSDRTIFLMRGKWQNLLVDNTYMARNTSTPANHGELLSMTESNNVTWSNNVMEDIEGTAFIAGLNGGTISNWKIFGNVAFHSAAYKTNTGRKPGHNYGVAGIIFIANDASNNNRGDNIQFFNNTMHNIQGSYSGVVIQSGSGNEVRNNIWYQSVRTNNSFSGAISHNWYYNTPQDGDSTATKVVCSAGCDILASPATKDFRLKAAVGGGAAMAAPYNADANGVTRGADGGWDRGAFEFGGAAASPVAAPKLFTAR